MFVHIVDACHAGLDVSNECLRPAQQGAGLNVAILTEAPPGWRDGRVELKRLVLQLVELCHGRDETNKARGGGGGFGGAAMAAADSVGRPWRRRIGGGHGFGGGGFHGGGWRGGYGGWGYGLAGFGPGYYGGYYGYGYGPYGCGYPDGYAGYYGDDGGYGGCYVARQRVMTPYGWRVRAVDVCE
jgi:hypothetical protein